MSQDKNEFPRRNRIDQYTPAEKSISYAVQAVEMAGAHPRLTDAVNLLAAAHEAVADFVDGAAPREAVAAPLAPTVDANWLMSTAEYWYGKGVTEGAAQWAHGLHIMKARAIDARNGSAKIIPLAAPLEVREAALALVIRETKGWNLAEDFAKAILKKFPDLALLPATPQGPAPRPALYNDAKIWAEGRKGYLHLFVKVNGVTHERKVGFPYNEADEFAYRINSFEPIQPQEQGEKA